MNSQALSSLVDPTRVIYLHSSTFVAASRQGYSAHSAQLGMHLAWQAHSPRTVVRFKRLVVTFHLECNRPGSMHWHASGHKCPSGGMSYNKHA